MSRDTLYEWLRHPEFKAGFIDKRMNWLPKDLPFSPKRYTVKVAQKPVIALSPTQVKDFLSVTSRYPTQRRRILLAVTPGVAPWRH